MIAWSYLDKRQATCSALRDYQNMVRVVEITPDDIKAAYEDMTAPRTPAAITVKSDTHDPLAGEKKLATTLDDIDVLRERYRIAVEFLKWFEPAWNTLLEEEQFILCEFYMTGSLRSGAGERLEKYFDIGHAQVERRRSRALSRLSLLLFGK